MFALQIRERSLQVHNVLAAYDRRYRKYEERFDADFDFTAKNEWASLTEGLSEAWRAYAEVVIGWMNGHGTGNLPTAGSEQDVIYVTWRADLQERYPDVLQRQPLPSRRPHSRESVDRPKMGDRLTPRQRRALNDFVRSADKRAEVARSLPRADGGHEDEGSQGAAQSA